MCGLAKSGSQARGGGQQSLGGFRKSAQLTGPVISDNELWRLKIFLSMVKRSKKFSHQIDGK